MPGAQPAPLVAAIARAGLTRHPRPGPCRELASSSPCALVGGCSALRDSCDRYIADHPGRRLIGARFIHPFGVRPHWVASFRCFAT